MGISDLLAADAAKVARLREEEQRLIDAFRVSGAVSPDRAQSLSQLNLARTDAFNRLETARVLRLVGRNLYYVDEAAVGSEQGDGGSSSPGLVLLVATLVLVAAAIVAYWFYWR